MTKEYEFEPGELVIILDNSAGHGRVARVLEVVRNFRTQKQYDSYMACHYQQKGWEDDGLRPRGSSYYSNPPDWKVGDEVEHTFLTEGVLSPNLEKGPRKKREYRARELRSFDEAYIDEEVQKIQKALSYARELCKGR